MGALAVVPQPGEGVQAAGPVLPLQLQQPLPVQGAGVPHPWRSPDRGEGRSGGGGERLVTSRGRNGGRRGDRWKSVFPMVLHHLPGCPTYASVGDTASEPRQHPSHTQLPLGLEWASWESELSEEAAINKDTVVTQRFKHTQTPVVIYLQTSGNNLAFVP